MNSFELRNPNLNAPKAPIDGGVGLRLSEMEKNESISAYFNLAWELPEQLTLSQTLFFVFCAWKLGRLSDLETLREHHFAQLSKNEFAIYSEFLRAHLLRTTGQIKEGFVVLESLCQQTRDWVVRYRYAAEGTSFYELSRAAREIEAISEHLPFWAQRVLSFNLGVIAINQGQMGLFSAIEKKISASTDHLSQFFLSWLRGGYYQQLEKNQKSADYYLRAIDLLEELPNRKTDLPILAFLAIQQSVWAGDIKASRRSWSIIEKVAKNKNTLSPESHSLSKAIYELNEGNLTEATLRFEVLFENTRWSKDHLRGAEFFFWVLMARGEVQRGKRLVRLLMEVRQSIGFPEQNSLLPIYQYYFDFLNEELSVKDLQKKTIAVDRSISNSGSRKR